MADQHRVLIIGGGYGGLYAAKALAKHDVDVTVAGLVSLWRRMAGGEDPGVHSAKWAILDALSRRAGSAYAPLLTELWEVDPDPTARRHVLLMLTRARDRAVRPWLDGSPPQRRPADPWSESRSPLRRCAAAGLRPPARSA